MNFPLFFVCRGAGRDQQAEQSKYLAEGQNPVTLHNLC